LRRRKVSVARAAVPVAARRAKRDYRQAVIPEAEWAVALLVGKALPATKE
jgi:hypothetical protein